MDEHKLTEQLYAQRPQPGWAFDERIDQQLERLMAERKEPVKRKVSILAVAVIALLAVTLIGALAEMIGLDLFGIFGKKDERIAALAPNTVLEDVSPVSIQSPVLGTAKAGIHSAWYDGDTLLVAYSIQDGTRLEPYTPTPEQLSAMDQQEPRPVVIHDPDTEALAVEWNQALANGTPFGYAQYSLSPSDHTVTDTGIDLPPVTSWDEFGEDGVVYTFREMESPLPEAVRGQEKLTFSIRLGQLITYHYFDGKQAYVSATQQETEPMRATVWRVESDTRRFEGTGQFQGLPVSVSATASAAWAEVAITLREGTFPLLEVDADQWYELYLTDQQGRELRARGGDMGGTPVLRVDYDGLGEAPQNLFLRILMMSEDGPDLQTAVKEADAIELKMIESR